MLLPIHRIDEHAELSARSVGTRSWSRSFGHGPSILSRNNLRACACLRVRAFPEEGEMARHADVRDDSKFYEDAPAIRSKPRKSRQHVQQQPRACAGPDERIAARLDEWCAAYNISEVVSVRPQTCSGATAEDGRSSPLEPPSVAPEGAVHVGSRSTRKG
jgi:hypothetical protein